MFFFISFQEIIILWAQVNYPINISFILFNTQYIKT